MNPYEITFRALLGTFLKHGICVERVNVGENTIYISLPKNSYVHGQGCIKNIDDQAKIIKKLLINIGILPSDGKVKYRGANVCWTKETGNENFINNIELVLGEY